MSKATKRKFVAKEVLDDFVLPGENQQIVRVIYMNVTVHKEYEIYVLQFEKTC